MKISKIILILSVVLFVSGIASATYFSYSLLEKYPDLQIMYQGELESGQQITTPINATKGKDLTVTILSDGRNNLFFNIEDANQDVVVENIFRETISYSLSANQSGIHIIGVGNMGDTSSMIGSFVTKNPITDTDFVESLGSSFGISYFLIFISIILFLIGLVMYFVQRKRDPQKKNSKLERK